MSKGCFGNETAFFYCNGEMKYLALNAYMKSIRFLLLALGVLITSFSFSQILPPPPPPDSISVDRKVFNEVEIEASYPGGTEAWLKFLTSNVNAAVPTDNGAPIGKYTVNVQFIVMKDGTISEIKALTNFGFGMEQEVIRTIKKSGLWSPAIQNGLPVRAYRRQPLTFQVEDDAISITTDVPYVFFTNTQNNLAITVDKVKPENLELTISQGSIINKGNGQFIVKVNKPGRVVIRMSNSKKNKDLGAASFEVREKE